jgi:hypothetical protein
MPDTYYLKLSEKSTIESALDADNRDYQFTGTISTDGFTTKPDGEGGQIITYKAKFVSEITLIDGGKSMIKGKKKGSKSEQLYRVLIKEAQLLNEDPQTYYEEKMSEIIKSREFEV